MFINGSMEQDKIFSQDANGKGAGSSKRIMRKINWRLRVVVLIRDNCICKMCGASPAKDPAVTLHVAILNRG